ncbi:MAG: CHAT domain-containing protein, partial [Pseudomonadota bacterium]
MSAPRFGEGQFYDAFRSKQLGLSESLRQAQLALKAHPRYRSPFFWSAYVLTSAAPTFAKELSHQNPG